MSEQQTGHFYHLSVGVLIGMLVIYCRFGLADVDIALAHALEVWLFSLSSVSLVSAIQSIAESRAGCCLGHSRGENQKPMCPCPCVHCGGRQRYGSEQDYYGGNDMQPGMIERGGPNGPGY